jgi:hypothetical protein
MGAGIRSRLVVVFFAIASLGATFAVGATPACAAGFGQASGSPFASPGATGALALGDVNGDGNVDSVVLNPATAQLQVFLGDGKGGLAPTAPVATGGTKPVAVALADLDGDGKLDAAVANEGSNNVSVLIGNGAGGFLPAPKSPFGTDSARPAVVITGDFNGDARRDVAVVNNSSADVSIMLGDGTGGLALAGPPTVTHGDHPRTAAAGDFNGDGKLDVAVGNDSGNVAVLIGDGTGKLSSAAGSPFGLTPAALGAGDFNGDGKLDVAVANTTGKVTILAGNGAGALTPLPATVPAITAGSGPSSLAVADVSRDGKLDIVIANAGSGDLTVLLGDGAGGFTAAPGTPVQTGGASPSSLALADLNGDGKIDLVAVNAGSASLSVLLNGVALPLPTFVSYPASPVPGQQVTFAYTSGGAIAAIDWDLNGDGIFDDAHGPSAARVFAAPGSYRVSLRVTDLDGFVGTATSTIVVGSHFSPPAVGRIAGSLVPKLIAPFPIVRITGRTAPRGARIDLLEVVAPAGAKVSAYCVGKGCPFRKWRKLVGARTLVIKPLRGRYLAAGAMLEVRVSRRGEIGKYTRIVIRKLKPPVRNDLCLAPGSSKPSQCPAT